jgi:hypothetical protein
MTAKYIYKMKYLVMFLITIVSIASIFFIASHLVPKKTSVMSKPLFDPLIHDISTVFDKKPFWESECIDTMKYSRDTARAWDNRPEKLNQEINLQIEAIKNMGANCVSLATPYDDQFIPFLKKWLRVARQNNLKIWFRGNFSGWEKWFDYPKLASRDEHVQKTYSYIVNNPDLFQDGDIFTPAPEAENGIFGDPRTGDDKRSAFNEFIKKSYSTCVNAFSQIGKNVTCGLYSTNYDVARDSFDPETVKQIGNTITIDHYISDAKKYDADIFNIHEKYNAKVAIGEFGAPIPDLNGSMGDDSQSKYVGELLLAIYKHRDFIPALNYWTLRGGSTQIIDDAGNIRSVSKTLKSYFSPGFVRGYAMPNTEIDGDNGEKVFSNDSGRFTMKIPAGIHKIGLQREWFNFRSVEVTVKSGEVTLIK